jgi:two-component system sensor histidine kinase DegS
MASSPRVGRPREFWRNPHFWLILAFLTAFAFLHYAEQLGFSDTVSPSLHFGLTRHALDRVLFLLPIIYCGFIFGLIAGLLTSFVALVIMLPRAIVISPAPADALLETSGVFVVGVLACLWLWTRTRERERFRATLAELETVHQRLQHYVRSARSNERRLTMLNAISTVLTESLELKSILHKAIYMVMELMDVEVALIFSLDEESQELVLAAYEGVSDDFARAVGRMKVGEGFNGEVARTGQPMVDDISRDPTMTRPEIKKMKIQSQLIVPLLLRDQVRGTLWVAMRRPRKFLPEEIELLSAVAIQMATAIENARLYEKEHLTAQRLAVSERKYRELFENASDAIWVHDLAGNIMVANKASEKLTGYSVEELTQMNVKVFLSDEGHNLAGHIRRQLFDKQPVAQPYEQRLIRKDGTEAILMLTTNLVTEDGKPTAFEHIARDVTEEKRMQDNLRYYLSQITKAQEEERKRIARELHDDTSQVLHAVSRQLDNFLRGSEHLAPSDVAFFKQLRQQLNDALEGVRRFSQALRPPMLDDLGLLPAVRWLAGEMAKLAEIEIDFKVAGAERRLPPEVELTLFRAIQEALGNVWRHAQASKAEVAVEFGQSKIMVSVSDNGKGFEPLEMMESLSHTGKLGLAGIEERMRLLGGSLKVQSEPGKGTTLIAEAPV